MELLNHDGGGVSWVFSKEMQDLLDNAMSKAGDTMLSSTPKLGNVLEILREVAGPVQMLLHKPRSGKRSMKAMRKTVNFEKNEGILLKSSSLMSLEDWDLTDNNTSLEKMQHKL